MDVLGCDDESDDDAGAGCPAGGRTASGSDDAFASGLLLSIFSDRRLDFLTEWMVDTFRR